MFLLWNKKRNLNKPKTKQLFNLNAFMAIIMEKHHYIQNFFFLNFLFSCNQLKTTKPFDIYNDCLRRNANSAKASRQKNKKYHSVWWIFNTELATKCRHDFANDVCLNKDTFLYLHFFADFHIFTIIMLGNHDPVVVISTI